MWCSSFRNRFQGRNSQTVSHLAGDKQASGNSVGYPELTPALRKLPLPFRRPHRHVNKRGRNCHTCTLWFLKNCSHRLGIHIGTTQPLILPNLSFSPTLTASEESETLCILRMLFDISFLCIQDFEAWSVAAVLSGW